MTSVKKELFSGVTYTAASQYLGILISLIVAGILARLLSPQDFGVVAIATVIITFFGIFSELGIAPAIIQNKELTNKELNEIFSFTIWMGLIISACFFVASWAIASYYKDSKLILICQLLSVNLFFAAINIVPNALIFKNKKFQFIAIRSIFVQITGGTIAIVAALLGAGVYALLINPIFSSIFIFLFSIRQYPQKVYLTWGAESMKKILSFSLYQFFFNVINYFSRNLDKLLIGRFMGLSPLGYYDKSYRLMMLPLQNITAVLTPVMHPVLSNLQNDLQQLERSYLKVVRFLAFIGFPLSAFLWFSAYEVMMIVFGNQWEPSVPAFQILALSVGIQIILSSSGSIFQAANATKIMFISGLLSAILNVTGILVGIFVFNTLEAVAWGICISFATNFIQSYLLMYRVTFKISMKGFFRQFLSPIILTSILIVVSIVLEKILPSLNNILSLAIKGVIYLSVFALYIQLTKEYDIVNKVKTFKIKR